MFKLTIDSRVHSDGQITDGVVISVDGKEFLWPFLDFENAYLEAAKLRLTEVTPIQRSSFQDCQHNTQLRLKPGIFMWCLNCGCLYLRTGTKDGKEVWAWLRPARFAGSPDAVREFGGEVPPWVEFVRVEKVQMSSAYGAIGAERPGATAAVKACTCREASLKLYGCTCGARVNPNSMAAAVVNLDSMLGADDQPRHVPLEEPRYAKCLEEQCPLNPDCALVSGHNGLCFDDANFFDPEERLRWRIRRSVLSSVQGG